MASISLETLFHIISFAIAKHLLIPAGNLLSYQLHCRLTGLPVSICRLCFRGRHKQQDPSRSRSTRSDHHRASMSSDRVHCAFCSSPLSGAGRDSHLGRFRQWVVGRRMERLGGQYGQRERDSWVSTWVLRSGSDFESADSHLVDHQG